MITEAMIYYRPPNCPFCGCQNPYELISKAKLAEWRSGKLIQNVWPEKDNAWKEWIRTGTHSDCFDDVFCTCNSDDECEVHNVTSN